MGLSHQYLLHTNKTCLKANSLVKAKIYSHLYIRKCKVFSREILVTWQCITVISYVFQLDILHLESVPWHWWAISLHLESSILFILGYIYLYNTVHLDVTNCVFLWYSCSACKGTSKHSPKLALVSPEKLYFLSQLPAFASRKLSLPKHSRWNLIHICQWQQDVRTGTHRNLSAKLSMHI